MADNVVYIEDFRNRRMAAALRPNYEDPWTLIDFYPTVADRYHDPEPVPRWFELIGCFIFRLCFGKEAIDPSRYS
jgi:hypothetical protein